MRHLKGIVLGFGLTLAAMSLLTACEHTAEGMKQDYQAATTPSQPAHHKKVHKHKTKKSVAATTDQTTNSQPTQQTMTNEPAAQQNMTNETQQTGNQAAQQQTTTAQPAQPAQQQNTTDTSHSY